MRLTIERFQYSWLEHTIIPLAARGGYTKAVNAGLRQSKADAVVLLNSDTIVPPRGIRKLRSALFSSDARGIVGPLSNAASYQSVPSVKGAVGQTAINPLPEGMTVHDLDQHLEASWNGIYPLTPLVHGFCLCIRRAVLEAIGVRVRFHLDMERRTIFVFVRRMLALNWPLPRTRTFSMQSPRATPMPNEPSI
ncbi:glycosyltransferase [Bradyrhizobium sp. CCBAU 051011]|uniref:glycosyltransferase n=1 Tax=Bradyrhizobium sp. CCBAU 051011 TaxID=858422 RepID=UPI00137ABDE8|nr:glycosyltransferase [Bradyrhizobium sp. CCBAU 051011]